MESSNLNSQKLESSSSLDFHPGDIVIYPPHGKCQILSIDERSVSGESVPFYRLEKVRSSQSRSSRKEPCISVPVAAAPQLGIRTPVAMDAIDSILEVLSSREYYFQMDLSWNLLKETIEKTVREEGIFGLAKAYSFFFVLKKRMVVLSPEAARLDDIISHSFLRELSDALNEPAKGLETKFSKLMRPKLTPDH